MSKFTATFTASAVSGVASLAILYVPGVQEALGESAGYVTMATLALCVFGMMTAQRFNEAHRKVLARR